MRGERSIGVRHKGGRGVRGTTRGGPDVQRQWLRRAQTTRTTNKVISLLRQQPSIPPFYRHAITALPSAFTCSYLVSLRRRRRMHRDPMKRPSIRNDVPHCRPFATCGITCIEKSPMISVCICLLCPHLYALPRFLVIRLLSAYQLTLIHRYIHLSIHTST